MKTHYERRFVESVQNVPTIPCSNQYGYSTTLVLGKPFHPSVGTSEGTVCSLSKRVTESQRSTVDRR
jgi:hypothetical protein